MPRPTLLTILLLAFSPSTLAFADPLPAIKPAKTIEGGPRVRPHDSRSAAIMLEGLRRSDTLRMLVERLEAHDVIVYIQMQPGMERRLGGSLTWLAATDRFRYVRISLNPTLSGPAAIATLGHELQHALEVADTPTIVDAQSLGAYYRVHGISVRVHGNGWDTLAAQNVGDEVRDEVAQSKKGHVVESLRDFDARDWHVVYRRAREEGR